MNSNSHARTIHPDRQGRWAIVGSVTCNSGIVLPVHARFPLSGCRDALKNRGWWAETVFLSQKLPVNHLPAIRPPPNKSLGRKPPFLPSSFSSTNSCFTHRVLKSHGFTPPPLSFLTFVDPFHCTGARQAEPTTAERFSGRPFAVSDYQDQDPKIGAGSIKVEWCCLPLGDSHNLLTRPPILVYLPAHIKHVLGNRGDRQGRHHRRSRGCAPDGQACKSAGSHGTPLY